MDDTWHNLKVILQEVASNKQDSLDDDFNPFDYYGGNFTDTFYGGLETGRIELARELLEEFFHE